MINSIYGYIDADDPDTVKSHLDAVVDFVIRLRHSYVDNDKPMSTCDLNTAILRSAELDGLRVGVVRIGDKTVDIQER